MKPLTTRNNEAVQTDEDSVSLVMSTVPMIMGVFKTEMRANRPIGLSVPQFRALIFVNKRPDTSISDVAEHLGLALSSASKLVDGLMKRDFVIRSTAADDRRRAVVEMTETGRAALQAARELAYARVQERLSRLSSDEEQAVMLAMRALSRVFLP